MALQGLKTTNPNSIDGSKDYMNTTNYSDLANAIKNIMVQGMPDLLAYQYQPEKNRAEEIKGIKSIEGLTTITDNNRRLN